MLLRTLIIICVLFVADVHQKSIVNSNKNNYVFDQAYLSLDYKTSNGFVNLKAYKAQENNVIIENQLKERYGQLSWVSIGNPEIILNKDIEDSPHNQIFEMRPEGFDIYVETLTDEHRNKFTQLIKETYNIDVKTRQILSLEPSNFECQIVFNSKNETILINGKAFQLNISPMKISFSAQEESKERILFEERLKNDRNKLNFDIACVISVQEYEKTVLKSYFNLKTDRIQIFNSSMKNELDMLKNKINEISLNTNDIKRIISTNRKSIDNLENFYKSEILFKIESLNNSFINILTISDEVSSLTVLPNGNLVSGSGFQNKIKIWNPNDGTLIRTLLRPFYVLSLTILQNGNLASGSGDKKINIWNPNNGTLIRKFIGTHAVNALTVLQNGNLASGLEDGTIIIWNPNDGSLLTTLSGHNQGRVTSLTVLPNGNLASGSADKTIKIWNQNDGSLIRTLTGHNHFVDSLAVLPNGNLASCSLDKTIKIWNPNDGSLSKTLSGHSDYVMSLTVLQNGNLVSGSADKTIKIWNPNDGSLLKTLSGHSDYVISLTVLKNGNLVSGSSDNTIKIWQMIQ